MSTPYPDRGEDQQMKLIDLLRKENRTLKRRLERSETDAKRLVATLRDALQYAKTIAREP